MRIISNFRDYYDSALCYGADPNLLYVRTEQVFKRDLYSRDVKKYFPDDMDDILRPVFSLLTKMPEEITLSSKRFRKNFKIEITSKIIGFCGILYPAMEIEDVTYYSPQSIIETLPDKVLDSVYMTREKLEELINTKEPWGFGMGWGYNLLSSKSWEKLTLDISSRKYDDVFVGLKSPIFRFEKLVGARFYQLTLNPCLKKDLFQKIKIPTDCFQEISMYVGNQLVTQEDPKAAISDDVLRDEKGFNKWSFRKHRDDPKMEKKK